MAKRVSATAAKNNFGGLLEDVATLGSIEIVRHGRVVAVVLSPAEVIRRQRPVPAEGEWRKNHMIAADLARTAHITQWSLDSDEDAS